MKLSRLAPLLTFTSLFAVGCGGEMAEEEDDLGESDQALLGTNALGINALGINALGINALGINALGINALGINSLSGSALAAIHADTVTGAENRQFLQYTVSCAFTPSQSFNFSWTDSSGVVHNESFPGLLGLAPAWASGPLTDITQQEMMSACLAARTNWYGVTVLISLRSKLSPLRMLPTDQELLDYSYVEGAFWGNLFGANPAVYACYEPSNEARSRAAHRDCAVGHLDANGATVECGIINILGPCSSWCNNLDPHERWYDSCYYPQGQGNNTSAAIAIALP